MSNGWSCNGTRFRMRWKIDSPRWIECRYFTECEILYHCTHHTISHLCCTTPQMLSTLKLNTIDKTLVPAWNKSTFILFLPYGVAKYSQHATNTCISFTKQFQCTIRSRKSALRSAKLLWHHTHCWEWYKTARLLCNSTRFCTLSSHRRVHNNLTRCCTIRNVTDESLWDNLGMSDMMGILSWEVNGKIIASVNPYHFYGNIRELCNVYF